MLSIVGMVWLWACSSRQHRGSGEYRAVPADGYGKKEAAMAATRQIGLAVIGCTAR